jgi:hypothetical protein
MKQTIRQQKGLHNGNLLIMRDQKKRPHRYLGVCYDPNCMDDFMPIDDDQLSCWVGLKNAVTYMMVVAAIVLTIWMVL